MTAKVSARTGASPAAKWYQSALTLDLKVEGATGQTNNLLEVDINKLVVQADGKVGFGADPAFRFVIEQTASNSGGGLSVINSSRGAFLWSDGTDARLDCKSNGSGTLLINSGNGKVGIGAATVDAAVHLDVHGKIKSTAALVVSDRRLKDNLEPVQNAGAKLDQITGYEYDLDGKRSAGLIAQEVEAILPQAVTTGDDGMKSLDYNQTIAVLVEALKEANQRITKLEEQINA